MAAQTRNPNLTAFLLKPGWVALMPNCSKRLSPQRIAELIRDGQNIYQSIQNGSYDQLQPNQNPPAIGEDDISVLMWYLQALAASKASISTRLTDDDKAREFKNGAMLIEDQNGKLKHFFDLANFYERRSNHFEQFQTSPETSARAIDLLGAQGPNNLKSILYQKLPDHFPSQGSKFLYVKMEPFGYRGLSSQETGYSHRTSDQAHSPTSPGFMGTLKRFFTNLGQTLRRIFSRDPDKRAIQDGTDNLEKVWDKLIENYNILTSGLTKDFFSVNGFIPILKELKKAKVNSPTGGVHAALEAIYKARQQTYDQIEDGEVKQRFLYHLEVFLTQLSERVGDHLSLRIGREVILTQPEFKPINPIAITSREGWQGLIEYDQMATEYESSILESNINTALSAPSEQRAALIRASNGDLNRQTRFTIYDLPEFPGGPKRLYYDTNLARTSRSAQSESNPQIPIESHGPSISEQVDDNLTHFSGSQKFSEAIRTILNQGTLSDLQTFNDYHLVSRTSVTVPETYFQSLQHFSLTRLTPRPTQGQQESKIVEYLFEASLPGGPSNSPPQGTPDSFVGTSRPSMSLTLRHNTETDQVSASIIEAHAHYEINRSDSPVPFDLSQVRELTLPAGS
jgi:hypothetical protein